MLKKRKEEKTNSIIGPGTEFKGTLKDRGDIDGEGKVEISSAGSLEGKVKASDLTIAEGAFFNGECRMNPLIQQSSKEDLAPEE